MSVRLLIFVVSSLLLSLGSMLPASAQVCDELVGRLLTKAIAPVIAEIDCGVIAKAGLNRREHRLDSICYTSEGPTSRLQLAATLRCKTSDSAFIKASISDRLTATATFRGADCAVVGLDISASGEIGSAALRLLNVERKARDALQREAAKAC